MRRHGPVIAHCTDSEDFPNVVIKILKMHWVIIYINVATEL